METKVEIAASKLMLLALDEEEASGEARIYGTIADIADRIGSSKEDTSLALRLTRTPEFIDENGYSFPSLGNGRSGARHGYVLEYNRPTLTLAKEQLHAHTLRLVQTLRSVKSQYELASNIVDGRTLEAKNIGMALKAVDLAADALEVGLSNG